MLTSCKTSIISWASGGNVLFLHFVTLVVPVTSAPLERVRRINRIIIEVNKPSVLDRQCIPLMSLCFRLSYRIISFMTSRVREHNVKKCCCTQTLKQIFIFCLSKSWIFFFFLLSSSSH